MAPHIRAKLVGEFDEVCISAARALGELGFDDGQTIALNGRNPLSAHPGLGGPGIGAIGRSDSQPALRKLLEAPEEPVRLAAATAILQLKPG